VALCFERGTISGSQRAAQVHSAALFLARFLHALGIYTWQRRWAMNARRVKFFATKLRDDLHEQWAREHQESIRKEAQQADLMRWALKAGTPKISHRGSKAP